MSKDNKKKTPATADDKLNEELFGDIDGLTFGTSQSDDDEEKVTYPFDCPALDIPMGGGVVSGKIYELFGAESHGKSTFALDMCGRFCHYWEKKDELYRVLWVESESAFDDTRASYMGLPIGGDNRKFIFYKTDIFEEGRDRIKAMLEKSVKKKMHLFIVWDTIAAVSTLKEKEATSMEDDEDDGKSSTNRGGLMEKPRLLKAMFRDMTTLLGNTQSTLVLVNQINIKAQGKYQFTTDSSGGHALRHHASVRMRVDRSTADDVEPTGSDGRTFLEATRPTITFVKNKLTGFTKYRVKMHVHINTGFDSLETRVLYLKEAKIMPPAVGGWSTFKIPVGYALKVQDKVEMTEVKMQSIKHFKNLMVSHPHMIDWLDYMTYKSFCNDSPLVKIKNIDKLWAFEEKFYKQRITKLANDERTAADIMFKSLIKDTDVEPSDSDKGNGTVPPKSGGKPAKTAEARTVQ